MNRRKTKRYIERTLSVTKLIKMIPGELLEEIGQQANIDHQVKHLHGALMFRLFLFSILKSERLSTRLLEFFYNSTEFKTFSGKGGHTTRHSSIEDRIKAIDNKYFEQIFEKVGGILRSHFNKKQKKVQEILRFDSSMVAIGAGLINWGMKVGGQPKEGYGTRQLKFTIGLKGILPTDANLFTGQSYLSEDKALREAIVKSSYTEDSIVVFDRGLQKRKAFVELEQAGTSFVTRANIYLRYEEIESFKNIKGRKSESLLFEKDVLVFLFDHNNKKIRNPFRLIKARSLKTDEAILFLTNIRDMNAREVSDVYHRRWDIEVFFRFIKQELNFANLTSYNENGIKVMMYMVLITAMLILAYKKENNIDGYKIAKLEFTENLQMEIVKEIVILCGGDPKKLNGI
jgi:hypothetical protein